MRVIIFFSLLIGVLATNETTSNTDAKNLFCYYDGNSFLRNGSSKMTVNHLEFAVQYCTHLVYGYAVIDPLTHELESMNEEVELDLGIGIYRAIIRLKIKYPHLKILLSVGGDKDEIDPESNKYLSVLESRAKRRPFINSAYSLIKNYGFDGLDLAWQFPKNRPVNIRTNEISGSYIVDEKAEEHNEELADLLRELKIAFRPDGLLLSLTVLPNVNSSLFFDVPVLINYLDFINLQAFDFATPDRNPEVAHSEYFLNRLNENDPDYRIDSQVKYWLDNYCPASKLNVGIASYGRAWKSTRNLKSTEVQPVTTVKVPGSVAIQDLTFGLLSWTDICLKLSSPTSQNSKGAKRFANYTFRVSDNSWVCYEDPTTASMKAAYVKANDLGGVALVDLSLDDFRGVCNGKTYPMLRAINAELTTHNK